MRDAGVAGEYMALTGHRLDGAEMYACGLATHFVPLQVRNYTTTPLST